MAERNNAVEPKRVAELVGFMVVGMEVVFLFQTDDIIE